MVGTCRQPRCQDITSIHPPQQHQYCKIGAGPERPGNEGQADTNPCPVKSCSHPHTYIHTLKNMHSSRGREGRLRIRNNSSFLRPAKPDWLVKHMYKCILVSHKTKLIIKLCVFLRRKQKQKQKQKQKTKQNKNKGNSIQLLLKLHVQFSAQGTKCSESWRMCQKNPGTSTQPETPPCTAPEIQNTQQYTVIVQSTE